MVAFRSILCPVDFSPHAARALRYAVALAGMAGAKLTVAWIEDLLLARAAVVYAIDPKGEQARTDLREFVAGALPSGVSRMPEPDLVVSVGTPEREILKIARKRHAELIVMGTHGLSGYQKMFFGSTTERVLRQTKIPVLAVPLTEGAIPVNTEGHLKVGTVVVAVDLGEQSKTLAGFGAGLARVLQAHPVILHVVETGSAPARWRPAIEAQQRSAQDEAQQALSLLDPESGEARAETVVLPGRPAEQIAAFAEARHAGLIVMGIISRRGRFGARPGSNAYRVLTLAPAPVLVVPPSNALTTRSRTMASKEAMADDRGGP